MRMAEMLVAPTETPRGIRSLVFHALLSPSWRQPVRHRCAGRHLSPDKPLRVPLDMLLLISSFRFHEILILSIKVGYASSRSLYRPSCPHRTALRARQNRDPANRMAGLRGRHR